jgi:hypothetical protein
MIKADGCLLNSLALIFPDLNPIEHGMDAGKKNSEKNLIVQLMIFFSSLIRS